MGADRGHPVHGGLPHPAGAPLADEEFRDCTAADLGVPPIDPPVVRLDVDVELVVRVVVHLVNDLRAMADGNVAQLVAVGPAVEDVRRLADSLDRCGIVMARQRADLDYVERILEKWSMRYTEPDAVTASAAARAAERWQA
jgi:hypothetical protein